ncbi:MAG: hypothetical protein KBB55_00860 [Candidatus Buchananbacteria bacterium]|nr:hypothetical protein [Candidatus Buchananbacteria bacterium]
MLSTDSNLSPTQLRLSYFIVTHERQLRATLVTILILISVIGWSYVLYSLGSLVLYWPQEQAALQQTVINGTASYTQLSARTPQSPVLGSSQLLSGSGTTNDSVVEISNPNADWLLHFKYRWAVAGSLLPSRDGFVLPGERKLILNLGVPSGGSLEIYDQQWQRVNPEEAVDRRANRNLFEIQNQKIVTSDTAGTGSRVSFDLVNRSAYSYWEVPFQIQLISGGSLVGVQVSIIDQFRAGETRHLEVPVPPRLPRIESVDVVADLDVFDDTNLMAPETTVATSTRNVAP